MNGGKCSKVVVFGDDCRDEDVEFVTGSLRDDKESARLVSVAFGCVAAAVVWTKGLCTLAGGCEIVGGSWVGNGGEPIFCNPRIEAGDEMIDVA